MLEALHPVEDAGAHDPQRARRARPRRFVAGREQLGVDRRGYDGAWQVWRTAALERALFEGRVGDVDRRGPRPHIRAALERPVAVHHVFAAVSGAVVDRAEEQGRVRVGHLRERGRPVAAGQLSHLRGDERSELPVLGEAGGGRYHQKVESMPSSSSIGFV